MSDIQPDETRLRGASLRPWELQNVYGLGVNYVILDAAPRAFGAVMSKNVAVLSDRHGHQLGLFRCTREGEFIGWGWIESMDGVGRAEYHDWREFHRALKSLAQNRGIRLRRGDQP